MYDIVVIILPTYHMYTHTHTHTHVHTQFKETLDTVANLDEELRERVHRLSVGSGTPAPPDIVAANNPSSVCNGDTISNCNGGPLKFNSDQNLSLPNELSVPVPSLMTNCPSGTTDPQSSNIN